MLLGLSYLQLTVWAGDVTEISDSSVTAAKFINKSSLFILLLKLSTYSSPPPY